MGHMFGFHFLENFNYPYTSTTIKEFWRRWHISLSTWFRDYLYIPLGGNRKGRGRTWLNRFLVFFATGLWHGASWTFVLWGLWHGLFSVLEDCGALPVKRLQGRTLGRMYTMLVVVLGFTLFRAETLSQAGAMFAAMFTGFGLGLGGHGGCVRAPDPGFPADAGFGACAVRTGRAATAPEARRSDPCGRACAARAVYVQPVRRHV